MYTVTLSLNTNAYAAGDVLADTQEVPGLRDPGYLHSVVILDEDDQKLPMDLVFFNANVSLGTENAAPNISDANARNILGIVRVNVIDYVDLGGLSVATKTGIGLALGTNAGAEKLYVGVITGGAPTHTAAGLQLRLGIVRA